LRSAERALWEKRSLEEDNDFSVEVAMKRCPIEAGIIGTDLRNLPRQGFTAGREESVVPCPSHYVFFRRFLKLFPD